MSDWPPWEWAGGDPEKCARVSYLFGAIGGAAGVFLVLLPLALLGLITFDWPPVPLVWWQVVNVAVIGVAVAFPILLPRRTAMVAALGISPVGLRLRLAFPFRVAQQEFVPWPRVRAVGPDWIEVYAFRGFGFLPERYRLTDFQARRLGSFLGSPTSPVR